MVAGLGLHEVGESLVRYRDGAGIFDHGDAVGVDGGLQVVARETEVAAIGLDENVLGDGKGAGSGDGGSDDVQRGLEVGLQA